MAITALPLASCSGAADCEPTVAAAQRVVVAASSAVRALLVDVPPAFPGIPEAAAEPVPDVGPEGTDPAVDEGGPPKPPREGRPLLPKSPPAPAGPDAGVLPVCACEAVLTA